MSLSKGMGEPWGNYLVADPFRMKFWKKIIKKIIEVVKRFIPKRRKAVLFQVQVVGSPFTPLQLPVHVTGNPFERKETSTPVRGDLVVPVQIKTPTIGTPFKSTAEKYQITGDVVNKISKSIPISGSLVSPFKLSVECEGKKDFKKMLWEILEDENGEE